MILEKKLSYRLSPAEWEAEEVQAVDAVHH